MLIAVPTDGALEPAVASCPAGSVIVISGQHKLGKPLVLDKDITLRGDGDAQLISEGHELHCAIHRAGRVHIENLALEARGVASCALLVAGGAELTVTGSTLCSKGGCVVECRGGGEGWCFTNCTLRGSDFGAGVYVFAGGGKFDGCQISDNGGDGVGVAEGAVVELVSCVITGNGESGLQLYHPESVVKMAKCRVRENTAGAVSFGEGAIATQIEAPPKQLRLLGLGYF